MKFNVRDLGGIEGYLGLDKGVDGNLKRYVVETASYNLSTAISSNLVNVMAIRLMGFGVLELSILTISRTLFVTLGSIVALPLIYRFREHRLKLWLVFGGLNRIGWALSIFTVLLPHPLNSVALVALVSAVQVSGAVAGIASTDTLADMIKPSTASRFLSVVSSINNIVALLALISTFIVFNIASVDTAYWILYIIALASAIISTVALALLKEVKVVRGDESSLTNPLDLVLKYKSVALETPTAKSYLTVTSAFHLAVNIPASFWDYYIMVVIGGNESWVTVKNIAMLSSKAIALRIWAPLVDSMGAKRSLSISMAAVSPIPLLYYNATSVFELMGVSIFSSVAWAPWDVATALYIYYLVPEDRRPAFTSLQNVSSNIVATLGSAMGS
jgi:hypothetical protein